MKPFSDTKALPGMRSLSDTLARLSTFRGMQGMTAAPESGSRLVELKDFGSNPGALKALTHVPPGLSAGAPLVVVLHGCTQTAAGYDRGSGWSALAERHGFALLYPEQSRANNPNGCFNWFDPRDARRDAGEAMSIRQMIEAFSVRHGTDPKRIFVTGLSAGGAMSTTMLACYPELFAGGAIVAGLPFGVANTVPEAFDRMRGHGLPAEAELQARLQGASSHKGPWPKISVWHGTSDATVGDANMEAIVAQWRAVEGVPQQPARTETVNGATRRVWRDAEGRDRIETYSIPGMGHGTPLDPRVAEGGGVAAPYMLDAGIASTRHIARFFGLIPAGEADAVVAPRAEPRTIEGTRVDGPRVQAPRVQAPRVDAPRGPSQPAAAQPADTLSRVGKVIEDALRAAGLMKRP